ncbi:SusD/RagB family nutrient-binding outer membrane lipoprotein [Parapedobacter lycopersici]|uniref:SusD/RagB family nutrient-binding outer membrane lipoprotein n=1 Tax=Parapedobacter lycopersici TaxID=1864939 RepID=UPI00333E1ED4
MKRINTYILGGMLSLAVCVSCDSGFDEMNINPIALTDVEPVFQLNSAIVSSAPTYGNLSYETTIVKQMITPFSGVGAAANFNQDNRNVAAGNWENGYRNLIKNLVDVINRTQDDPAQANLYHIARIWRAFAFMVLTDTYGDIPYFGAGQGYLENVSNPVYDAQEAIYADLLNELEGASSALDPAGQPVPGEVLYGGDITKWKRLGNSLLLRAAMRLSKVDPGKAADYAARAVAGGVMESNDDNAIIRHNANFNNPIGSQLNGGQSAFYYLTEDFVDYLKMNDDPRLTSIAVRYIGATSGADQTEGLADRSVDVQIGMPQGYDNTTVSEAVAASGLASLWDYSQLDRTRMADPQAPSFLVTHAQTRLLLAEAAVRGWISDDAAALYADGVRAHMQQLAAYGGGTAIGEDAITTYLAAHPLDAGAALEQINTEYWVASFLNGPEAFANFRRSGYPELTPNPYPGSDLQSENFIRRITYPDSELNVNQENVQQAITRQGPDLLDTRVWWDIP